MFAPAAFNQNGRDYLLSANTNVMICVQIESRTAVENVEAIASVEGIGLWPMSKQPQIPRSLLTLGT
jgi:4-hydroxy-2-oxoheptanedioate aldolase